MNNWLLEELTKDAVEEAVGKAVEKAVENTREKDMKQVAKKLLIKGTDVDTIVEVTELSKEEIERLATC